MTVPNLGFNWTPGEHPVEYLVGQKMRRGGEGFQIADRLELLPMVNRLSLSVRGLRSVAKPANP